MVIECIRIEYKIKYYFRQEIILLELSNFQRIINTKVIHNKQYIYNTIVLHP